MSKSPESNWDRYYGDDRYAVPEFIDNALWRNYEAVIRRHVQIPKAGLVVAELGGANSVYYHRFKMAFRVAEYHIVDNNEFGLNLFRQKDEKTAHLHNFDLLKSDIRNLGITADVVFSSGLIEHFVPEDTKSIVESHFAIARGAGLVLLSFPTPTLIYWAFRRFLEATDKFPPLFERPIKRDEIEAATAKLGEQLERFNIWTTILTQLLTLHRKS